MPKPFMNRRNTKTYPLIGIISSFCNHEKRTPNKLNDFSFSPVSLVWFLSFFLSFTVCVCMLFIIVSKLLNQSIEIFIAWTQIDFACFSQASCTQLALVFFFLSLYNTKWTEHIPGRNHFWQVNVCIYFFFSRLLLVCRKYRISACWYGTCCDSAAAALCTHTVYVFNQKSSNTWIHSSDMNDTRRKTHEQHKKARNNTTLSNINRPSLLESTGNGRAHKKWTHTQFFLTSSFSFFFFFFFFLLLIFFKLSRPKKCFL